MRDDSLDLVLNHLFEPEEIRKTLPPSAQTLLTQVSDCYTRQFNNNFISKKELRIYLVDKYKISVSQAYNIIALSRMALGDVKPAHKNWIKTKCETLMDEAYAAAQAKDLALAAELRKQAKTLGDIYRLDVDEGELLEVQKYLTIDKVEITINPEDIGIKFSDKDKAKAEEYMKKFAEDVDFDEVTDD